MINKLKMLTAVGITSAFLLAGCGSDEAGSSTETPENDSKEIFKVGATQITEHPSLDAAFEGFKKALADEGLEVEYDVQSAQGDPNNNGPIAQKFVGDGVDLIFANSTPSAQSALNATRDIPIVFTSVTDPIGAELVKSFENTEGNVTGTVDNHPEAIPNTVEFLAEHFEGKTVGLIYNAGEQNSVAQIDIARQAGEKAGLEFVEATVSTTAEVKQAAESLIGKAELFYVLTDNTVVSGLDAVIMVANENNIPLFVGELDSVAKGGFAAFGFNYEDIGYEAGLMAAQILKGEKQPSELPVQYPQNLKLVINKKAAEEMNIEMKEEWDSLAEYIE
ncbi:ABC transporter substrate-binding protein [Bacillus sp. B15-48]|uniref:ABC transporter substrate-binding protein n=1 Tax=Bacillus sp. B15-48 TaxID=1548601 RepID=UPI00193FDA8D|nr:ABC transporter substrate-binding protein [Bacillus sp. B15-48]MBM4764182.1 ABC transporter substrate-binding protein [Bacillus sp. B15-48]